MPVLLYSLEGWSLQLDTIQEQRNASRGEFHIILTSTFIYEYLFTLSLPDLHTQIVRVGVGSILGNGTLSI